MTSSPTDNGQAAAFAAVAQLAGADRQDPAALRLLLGGVRQQDAARRLLLGLQRLDHHAVIQRPNLQLHFFFLCHDEVPLMLKL